MFFNHAFFIFKDLSMNMKDMLDLLDGADTGELDEVVDLLSVLGINNIQGVDAILHHNSLESDLACQVVHAQSKARMKARHSCA